VSPLKKVKIKNFEAKKLALSYRINLMSVEEKLSVLPKMIMVRKMGLP
jgi:hypothetical protein